MFRVLWGRTFAYYYTMDKSFRRMFGYYLMVQGLVNERSGGPLAYTWSESKCLGFCIQELKGLGYS
jgi:hypothetical protein